MICCSFFLGVWVATSLKKESAKFDLFRENRYSSGVLTTLSNNYKWFELNYIFISRWQCTRNNVQINKRKKLVTMLLQRKKKLWEENIVEINYRVRNLGSFAAFFPQHNFFSNLSWHFIPKTFPLSLRESVCGFRDILFSRHFLPFK